MDIVTTVKAGTEFETRVPLLARSKLARATLLLMALILIFNDISISILLYYNILGASMKSSYLLNGFFGIVFALIVNVISIKVLMLLLNQSVDHFIYTFHKPLLFIRQLATLIEPQMRYRSSSE